MQKMNLKRNAIYKSNQMSQTFACVPKYIKIVVEDDSYDRMMTRLVMGEPFVKTFLGHCPHKSPRMCKCSFRKNILVDNEIMREIEGKLEKVWAIRHVLAIQ